MPSYIECRRRLTPRYGQSEAAAIVRLVAETEFGLSRADVLCGALGTLNDADTCRLETIMQRLEQGEPVQYILGTADFCGRQFRVAPGVLIPRPETEALAQSRPPALSPLCILDIGTGSGCIAITIKLSHPDAHVEAWDISVEALSIAAGNASGLGADVTFRQQDILSPSLPEGEWTWIVSNPPYICRKEAADMEEHVLQHEPDGALFVPDDDPLLFYRAIGRYACSHLCPGGRLSFELNALYATDTADMLRDMGFSGVTIEDDIFGKPRILHATR